MNTNYLVDSANEVKFTLDYLHDEPVWVGWREVARNGTKTKPPFQVNGLPAATDDPDSWSRYSAALTARNMAGVGIIMGIGCGDEATRLGGVDLDTCIDEEGTVAPWAWEVVERLRAYTEISPSLTGVKIFFRYRDRDLPALRTLMGTQHSRNFKFANGAIHAPGMEFHLSARYFTVTRACLPGFDDVREIDLDTLTWLVADVGPRIGKLGQKPLHGAEGLDTKPKTATHPKRNGGDTSRSARAYKRVWELRFWRGFVWFEEIREALLNDPDQGIVEWMHEKGVANDDREYRRIFQKTIDVSGTIWAGIGQAQREDALLDASGEDSSDESEDRPIQEGTPNDPNAGSASADRESPKEEGDPLDIFEGLVPEPVLTPDMLPKVIADFAFDTAERMGITPETVAMAALAAAAGAMTAEIEIQPTEDTGWTEPPLIWCKAVGDPGVIHTAVLNAVCKPLEEIEHEWRLEDAEKMKAYERDYARYKERLRRWDRGHTEDGDTEPVEPEKPRKRRLIATDYTMEKLAVILADNPRGILLKIDELAGFTGGFDAYRGGKIGKDRPNALKLWDGGFLPIDRMDRDLLVPNWGAGVVGKVQENKLAAMAATLTDDGLMQRFLVYRIGTVGMGSHRMPNELTQKRYEEMIRYMVNLRPTGRPVRLTREAQGHQQKIEKISFALKGLPFLSPALRAHAAKLNGMYARLLLVFHMIERYEQLRFFTTPYGDVEDGSQERVSGESAKRARDLMVRFLIPNATRIYADHFDQHDERGSDVRKVALYILAKQSAQVSKRDFYRAEREMLNDDKRILRTAEQLCNLGWLTSHFKGWKVNPRVHVRFADRAEQERQRRARDHAAIVEKTQWVKEEQGEDNLE
jgi:hypothetical protein